MDKQTRKGAFIIIRSAEGKRTSAHKYISGEDLEKQREVLAKQGLKRIVPVWKKLFKG